MSRRTDLAKGVTLYLGDCRELFEKIGPVDHTISDPPYEATMHVAKKFARGKKVHHGSRRRIASMRPLSFASIDGLREAITAPLVDMTAGWLLLFCTPEGIAPWRDAIEAAAGRYKRACFWDKIDAAPQFNGQGPSYGVEPFVTAWCGSGPSRWNGGGRRNIFSHPTRQPDRHGGHETEKPVALMAELVSLFTKPGDVVFDPFMGSGTTGVAAVKSGRRFVGVEKDPAFFDIALARVRLALQQPDFFVSVPKPKQQRMAL